jgi:hypothetical protein
VRNLLFLRALAKKGMLLLEMPVSPMVMTLIVSFIWMPSAIAYKPMSPIGLWFKFSLLSFTLLRRDLARALAPSKVIPLLSRYRESRVSFSSRDLLKAIAPMSLI